MRTIITLGAATIFSVLSTAVMTYIALATPIGPWIAPTIALCCLLAASFFSMADRTRFVSMVVCASSVGGIAGTAVAFSFPAIYFLDPVLFFSWLAQPLFFVTIVGCIVGAAGALGILCADWWEDDLLVQKQLPFPIGQMVYRLIDEKKSIARAYELLAGGAITIFFYGMRCLNPLLVPLKFPLLPRISWGIFHCAPFALPLWPMLWAIGFVTGHVIAIPLLVGVLAKCFFIDALHKQFFASLSHTEFLLAFCSGLVLWGVVNGVFQSLKKIIVVGPHAHRKKIREYSAVAAQWVKNNQLLMAVGVSLLICGSWYFFCPFLVCAYLLATCIIATYQVLLIAGKIGIAPLGRFATFVMLPALLFLRVDPIIGVVIATFVEVCVGVAADVLFGRKLASMVGVDRRTTQYMQWFGLLISAVTMGVVFLIILHAMPFGSAGLAAYKAQSRALLINAHQFNYLVLVIGMFFAYLLSGARLNAPLVLGGLLMDPTFCVGLIFGGLLASWCQDQERWQPFWSGVFVADSLWMLFCSIFR